MKLKLHFLLLIILNCCFVTTVTAQQPTLEWSKRFNGKDNTLDRVIAVVVDAKGNSYVTGTSEFSWIATVKYSPSGEQLWEVLVKDYSEAVAIAVDSAGGVFVTGKKFNSESSSDFITIRYDAATGLETWTSRYDGPGSGRDEPAAIAVDNLGGVYVTGYSRDPNMASDYTTIRYDAATGQESWVRHYKDLGGRQSVAAAIATDNRGGIYITGRSYSEDYVYQATTIRYDAATGEESWIGQYNESENSDHIGTAIAVDDKGGVYITGYIKTRDYGNISYPTFDYLTVRFDAATGEQTWARRYDGPDSDDDIAGAIAVDNSGGVFVTGYSRSREFVADYTTIRYDAATGEEVWVRHYNGPDNNSDEAMDIAVDNRGGVYVTGYSYRYESDSPDAKYVIIRYSAATGQEDWVNHIDSFHSFGTEASAIAIDNQGGVYIVGTNIATNTTFDLDYVTARYAAETGEETWINRYNRVTNTSDIAFAVVVDAKGNSYVTGSSPKDGSERITTVKYSPTGQQLWVRQVEENSKAIALAVDNRGGVFVTGLRHNEASSTTVTVRYDANTGEEVWKSLYKWPDSHSETGMPTAIAVDSVGGVYVTGYNFGDGDSDDTSPDFLTIRYDAATGEQTWTKLYDGPENGYDRATAIAADNHGGIYVTGYSINGTFTNTVYTTIRYEAATGQEAWIRHYDGPDSNDNLATAIAVDRGSVYVTGFSGYTNSSYATVRYDAATGEEIWARHYKEGPKEASAEPVAIAVDDQGGLFVTGNTFTYSDEGDLVFSEHTTIRYESGTGERSWASSYKESGRSLDHASAMVIDNKGGVYVSGHSYSSDTGFDLMIIHYDSYTGEKVWVEHYDAGSDDRAVDLALDSTGNVIVTGYSYSPETNFDFLTQKYSRETICPTLPDAAIRGGSTVRVGTDNSTYSLSTPGATAFIWSITDPEGKTYTSFTGQGTAAIRVNWPSEPEMYKVSVSYSAGQDCSARKAVTYVHVFDEEAGFVTGGGWTHSPAAPAHEWMRTEGKAYWGVGAKYKAGQQVQTQGSLMLLLESNKYVFRSTNTTEGSLVIADNRAYYTGTGVLTRTDNSGSMTADQRRFAYLVSAVDGDMKGGKGKKSRQPDRLRILVWEVNKDGSRGQVVYDNQLACPGQELNAPACQPISGGNITIHKKGLKSELSLLAASLQAESGGLSAHPTAFSESTTLSFTLERDADYSLELYDLKGALVRKVAEGTARAGRRTEHELVAEGLPQGLYLIRLSTGSEVQTAKIIVQQ
ncbi:outer membrane protein assembly factor BamB family protein [Pontibacter ramchanderi]|uniref:Putative delta-60 repeat protein/predicted secreted protein (Por secretion system target) n=1 Tax=Pontibacter ramchanderi TaxID=1179743 RepID=A0A2N3V2Z7_9BACT|nr:PQQ-binding-like beta-propeller repeat protein [Pontibacter ramchanderi]PKV75946.1 putative delta-60 repeat protein/predicted secreted protein (Por secretion system target) [Pontibacter ramchanderi]